MDDDKAYINLDLLILLCILQQGFRDVVPVGNLHVWYADGVTMISMRTAASADTRSRGRVVVAMMFIRLLS